MQFGNNKRSCGPPLLDMHFFSPFLGICVCICFGLYVNNVCMCMCVYVYVCACECVCAHVCVCVCVYICHEKVLVGKNLVKCIISTYSHLLQDREHEFLDSVGKGANLTFQCSWEFWKRWMNHHCSRYVYNILQMWFNFKSSTHNHTHFIHTHSRTNTHT